MTNKIFTVFEIVCILCWVAGMFAVGALKSFYWALPAGYGAGMIFARWFIEKKKVTISGVVNSRTASPEVKKAMNEMIRALKESGKLGDIDLGKKCDDPHCSTCWGLADKDEKQI